MGAERKTWVIQEAARKKAEAEKEEVFMVDLCARLPEPLEAVPEPQARAATKP